MAAAAVDTEHLLVEDMVHPLNPNTVADITFQLPKVLLDMERLLRVVDMVHRRAEEPDMADLLATEEASPHLLRLVQLPQVLIHSFGRGSML